MLETVFALRYQVYCVNRGFLRADDYPDGLERDEFDAHASHFCAMDRQERVIGAARLVRTKASTFPFQHRCAALFEDVTLPPPEQCAEVSRLVIDRNHPRRGKVHSDRLSAHFVEEPPLPAGTGRHCSPEIVLGLYRAMFQHSRRHGIRFWYAAMERSLARALRRFNLVFQPIGPEVDYFGPVCPYLGSLDDLIDGLGRYSAELRAWFEDIPQSQHRFGRRASPAEAGLALAA
jgi:N-acyl amino acid synthase of PEP-CTERM/exosortase system